MMQSNRIFGTTGRMNTNRVWYAPKADIKSPDTIHQILMFGKLSEIETLKKALRESTVKELFVRFHRVDNIMITLQVTAKKMKKILSVEEKLTKPLLLPII